MASRTITFRQGKIHRVREYDVGRGVWVVKDQDGVELSTEQPTSEELEELGKPNWRELYRAAGTNTERIRIIAQRLGLST